MLNKSHERKMARRSTNAKKERKKETFPHPILLALSVRHKHVGALAVLIVVVKQALERRFFCLSIKYTMV